MAKRKDPKEIVLDAHDLACRWICAGVILSKRPLGAAFLKAIVELADERPEIFDEIVGREVGWLFEVEALLDGFTPSSLEHIESGKPHADGNVIPIRGRRCESPYAPRAPL